jgi:hypothetical protein
MNAQRRARIRTLAGERYGGPVVEVDWEALAKDVDLP